MILLDDDSSKLLPSTQPTLRFPEPAAGRSSLSLPDYETSQAQQRPATHLRNPSKLPFPSHFDSRSRFWRAIFFALAIYVFLTVVIGIPLIVTKIILPKKQAPPNLQNLFLEDSDAAGPFLFGSDNMVMAASSIQCDAWDSTGFSNGLFTASVRRSLSPTGLFSVRSNATDEVLPRAGGSHNLTVAVNADASETHVLMDLTLSASSLQLRKAAHFCFSPTGTNRGYSIYMPQNIPLSDYLAFDIRVLFPQSSQLLTPTDMITYLPMFHQVIGPLSPHVRIANINIAGAGVDIDCDNLQADKIAVKTSFAAIKGTFSVSQSLALDNIEGPIYTNVTLVNDPTSGLATYIKADTGNSDLNVNITMASTSSGRTPHYNSNLRTFNGSLAVTMTHENSTPPAVVQLQVTNNQAPTKISLDSRFSGAYDLRSKLAAVRIKHPHMPSDWHVYTDTNSTSTVRGWAGWGMRPTDPNPSSDGKVTAVSSLSPIVLQLGT
ncbi:Zn(2)-C6 fungal-type domain-containing protein [Mycena indigotica]|uniref:Zn(2)-C6 fungal-type domain-containing protein n=1 Tax=Mycena indigotica TaxID=2126181 RepID=A0A8H6TDH2_9AGAR|nr:Zn(2)-C6 fungal-type domain-containing protein [Mycena indigotica]KAF7315465.1 Zn(2)-C6 fungal-type domain-containing protein [Mycena indigotica]